jgi:hypothetical protein
MEKVVMTMVRVDEEGLEGGTGNLSINCADVEVAPEVQCFLLVLLLPLPRLGHFLRTTTST